MRRLGMAWFALAVASVLWQPAAHADDGDAFIAGYATSLLERDFAMTGVSLRVEKGIVTLHSLDLLGRDREKVIAALSRIRGVRAVRVLEPDEPPPGAVDPPSITPASTRRRGWQFLPDNRIFDPLLADPRWPHFSVGYGRVIQAGAPALRDVGMISLGEHVHFVEYGSEVAGRFGAGLQPAVHGLFDLNAPSKDLVNADYRLGVPVDYRLRGFSTEAALFHQSSHLGDEFVFRFPQPRINLSYEAVTVKISQEIGPVRVYAGFGRMVHSIPHNLPPWWAQQGVEVSSLIPGFSDSVAPVLAVHLEEHEKSEWNVDLSLRAGVEFINPAKSRRRFQILFEYFRGFDPNGQFFVERIETIGLGIHLYF
jgi:hypothetical protein